jgi:putative transposase
MLEYKAEKHGRTFARVNRFFPFIRMCSQCGLINQKSALSIRSWTCLCGIHDRHFCRHRAVKR